MISVSLPIWVTSRRPHVDAKYYMMPLSILDMEESFFVGDAAGRPGDHNDTDRKWAVNAGLKFLVPEQLFK